MIDYEQIAQEDALFPWLASDCMADYLEELQEYNYCGDSEDDND